MLLVAWIKRRSMGDTGLVKATVRPSYYRGTPGGNRVGPWARAIFRFPLTVVAICNLRLIPSSLSSSRRVELRSS